MTLSELKESLLTASYDEAVKALSDYIAAHPDDDEALTARGMKHWGAGKRSLAINDYLAAIAINPESTARHALRAASDILDYRNKDLYNP
ncbi:MAG: hypothetical protein HDR94_03235 [Bacteroides sp.]|nr:hypothetical protein [Bacteroidales bacterium]MBD5340564.1 hypothetical protein [Bacteroides sp.]